MTDPADRLAEIKGDWIYMSSSTAHDVMWLVDEVERLRAAEGILRKLVYGRDIDVVGNEILIDRWAIDFTETELAYLAALNAAAASKDEQRQSAWEESEREP